MHPRLRNPSWKKCWVVPPTSPLRMEASAWVGVQGRTVAKGVIRDRSEAEARTEQDQFRDASDFAMHMGELTLTERTWNGDEAAAKLEQSWRMGRSWAKTKTKTRMGERMYRLHPKIALDIAESWAACAGSSSQGRTRIMGVIHPYNAVSPFLVVFVDLLTKVASL
jgi:hypothetical protein